MTDDEILREADRIKARRLNQARLAIEDFLKLRGQAMITLRWKTSGKIRTGITVYAVTVNDVDASSHSESEVA